MITDNSVTGLRKADARVRGVQVCSYADALAVLTSASFRQIAHAEPAPSAALLRGTTITLHGREHVARRRLENPLFEPGELRRYEGIAAAEFDRELGCLYESAENSGVYIEVDLVAFVRPVVARFGASLIGIDVDRPGALAQFASFAKAFEDAVQDSDFKTEGLDSAFWDGFDRAEIARFQRELVEPSWARRRARVRAYRSGAISAAELPADLLTLLTLDAVDWDEQDVVREIVLYMIGATGTSTQSIFESVVELAGWLDGHPGDRELISAAGAAAFVASACIEAIRLRPPPPSLIRVAERAAELPSGLRIAAGDIVHVDLRAANADAAWFAPNPDDFDPHRQPRDRSRPFGLAFGAGAHMCIGQRLALGRAQGSRATDEPIGVVPRIVLALVRAGVELDPHRSQQLKRGTLRRVHLHLPVRFERDALGSYLRGDTQSSMERLGI